MITRCSSKGTGKDERARLQFDTGHRTIVYFKTFAVSKVVLVKGTAQGISTLVPVQSIRTREDGFSQIEDMCLVAME